MMCHKCKYNGQQNNVCLSCHFPDDYKNEYQLYILDGYDFPQPEKNEPEKIIDGVEDETIEKLKMSLIKIFDLTNMQLLVLKGIINQKSITTIAKELTELTKEKQSRFKVFQIRKQIYQKFPEFRLALLTSGQRKELKKN